MLHCTKGSDKESSCELDFVDTVNKCRNQKFCNRMETNFAIKTVTTYTALTNNKSVIWGQLQSSVVQ